jgi:TonB family protein
MPNLHPDRYTNRVVRLSCLLLCCLLSALATGTCIGQDTPQPMLKVSAQVMAARLLTTVTPESPKMPKCSNRMVTLDVVIGEDGRVGNIKVLGGFEEFRDSAIKAVKQWTYKPYVENGAPAAVETTILVFYPSEGAAGSLYIPDGKGGVKGGKFLPMPSECGPPIQIKQAHHNRVIGLGPFWVANLPAV